MTTQRTGRWLLWLIGANLAALLALVFIYPHLMLSPGPLVAAHAELTTDCFACHTPWRGASAARCSACHLPADIGLRSTAGVPIVQRKVRTSFHQQLIESDCMACHSDHLGPKLIQRSRKPFSHALLRPEVRSGCETCHLPPVNTLHTGLKLPCSQCHKAEAWKPAGFDHALLTPAARLNCQTCHKPPGDAVHRQIGGNCQRCHAVSGWKPATLDHSRLFVLDGDHNVACATCHANDDYSRYACYGCHEHSPDRIRAKHREEGIADLANCVRCHRSASEKGEGGERGREGGGKRSRERD